MNMARAFVEYMESEGLGTFGDDIYIGTAPLNTPDPIYWVISTGGTPISKNSSGERQKRYIVSVYYRNTDAQDVYEKLHTFEETINSTHCTDLTGFDTIEMECTLFTSDQDIDNEDRTVGLLQVSITTYL